MTAADDIRSGLERRARRIATARSLLRTEMLAAADEARAAVGELPETEIASFLGVDRMTVRKWLGK